MRSLPTVTPIHETGHDLVLPGYAAPVPRVQIDWQYFIDRRPAILAHTDDLPDYLLMPEINRLINAELDARRHLLLNTLWHTGARISEALALTPGDFYLDDRLPYVSIETKKKRGRPKKKNKKTSRRMISIYNSVYAREVASYLASTTLKKNERIWSITRQTAYRWVERAVQNLAGQGHDISIHTTPHTFRHSFAINAVIHCVQIAQLQPLLGHERRESTEIYTQILSAESGHVLARVAFQ